VRRCCNKRVLLYLTTSAAAAAAATTTTTTTTTTTVYKKEFLVVIKVAFCVFVQFSKPGVAFTAILFMKHHCIMAKPEKTETDNLTLYQWKSQTIGHNVFSESYIGYI
jgi:hypothetical protein